MEKRLNAGKTYYFVYFNISWPCEVCTFLNSRNSFVCEVCDIHCEILSVQNLSRMSHIIIVDLDNWGCFFNKLPSGYFLPPLTFVHGFYGGDTTWSESSHAHIPAFAEIFSSSRFKLHKKCLRTKNAADFAIYFHVGLKHGALDKAIPFTIVSGDGDFNQILECLAEDGRQMSVLNPHRDEFWFIKLISLVDK
jgi:hypothetical protein